MTHRIPLSRLSRLVGQPRSVLQRMAQQGELVTFDGHVELEEVLRHFPDIRLDNEAELRRVETIKEQALSKVAARPEIPDAIVLRERLKSLGRDFAEAQGRLKHYERVIGWVAPKLAEAVEAREITQRFSERFQGWLKRELAEPATDLKSWEDLIAMERVMKVMSAQVTVLPGGQSFEVMGDETLLEAGLRAGLALPYGCSNGTCGQCKCRVTSGEVIKVTPHDYRLSPADKREGHTLACAYTAVGDITIEVPLWGVADIPEQTIVARVRTSETLGPKRIALHLLTPRAERLRYLAGQQIEITIGDQSRIVPCAGCPCEERRLEVHVLCDRETDFDRQLLAGLKPDTEVTVRGPFGDFVLDDTSERPVVFICSGPGFAPIKSLLQHALSLEHAPFIALYRHLDEDGPYQENLLKSYAGALDHFHYIPFPDGKAPEFTIGEMIADVSASLRGNMAAADVYLAGKDDFVAQARSSLTKAGIPEAQLKSMSLS